MSRDIDFALSEEERLAQESARAFARTELAPHVRAHEQGGVPETRARAFAALGLAEARSAISALAEALVVEELAAADGAVALVLHGGPAAYFGRAPAWVHLGEGPAIPFALASPRALLVGDGQVRLARAQAEPIAALALHAGHPCEMITSDVEAVACSTEEVRGALQALRRLQAALLVGTARASLEYAVRYTQERVTFGRPVAHHQAVAFLLAEMAMRTEAARLLLWRACVEPAVAPSAFAEAAEAALGCAEMGVQLLGGHGILKDHPQEKRMREARALATLWGGRGMALEEAAA